MEILNLLKQFHDQLLSLSAKLIFNKRDQLHLHSIALYGTLIELTGCIIQLIENNGRTGIPSIFRSFLEAAVELRNLSRDSSYVDNMKANHSEQWLKVLNEAKKSSNPYLKQISALPNLDALIADQKKQLDELRAKGKKALNVSERFDKADMIEEYKSLYNYLSCDAHSNIRALISRHIEINEEDFEVVYYKDEPVETFMSTLDSTAGLLIEASLSLHKLFESEHLKKINDMLATLTATRAKYA